MSATALLNYPGTWAWLAVVAVLIGGLAVFAVALRRTMRSPPLDAQRSASSVPPSAPSAPVAPAASAPSENHKNL